MAFKWTPKRTRFVDEYLVDHNATKAAERAGFSVKTADKIGWELLRFPEIKAAVDTAMAERSKRTEITQDRVLKEFGRVGFADIRKLFNEDGGLKRISDLDDDIAACVASVEVVTRGHGPGVEYVNRIKLCSKLPALNSLAEHLGLFRDNKPNDDVDWACVGKSFARAFALANGGDPDVDE